MTSMRFHNVAVQLIFMRSFVFILEADQSTSTNTAPVEADSTYEGVEPAVGEGSVNGGHMTGKDRSESVNWDHLTKSTKPENIEGIIFEGIY